MFQRPRALFCAAVLVSASSVIRAPAAHANANDAPLTITIKLESRQLVVARAGQTIRVMRAAVGKATTPTPIGTAKVLDVRPTQDPRLLIPVGPFNLRLDAKSAVVPDYAIDGWPGIVIQGTNCPKSCLGNAVTSGSVRVSNANVTWLAKNIPIGTAVEIV
jgi:lipoprotein-anchoring transpeptidase ErfK/SrfK